MYYQKQNKMCVSVCTKSYTHVFYRGSLLPFENEDCLPPLTHLRQTTQLCSRYSSCCMDYFHTGYYHPFLPSTRWRLLGSWSLFALVPIARPKEKRESHCIYIARHRCPIGSASISPPPRPPPRPPCCGPSRLGVT